MTRAEVRSIMTRKTRPRGARYAVLGPQSVPRVLSLDLCDCGMFRPVAYLIARDGGDYGERFGRIAVAYFVTHVVRLVSALRAFRPDLRGSRGTALRPSALLSLARCGRSPNGVNDIRLGEHDLFTSQIGNRSASYIDRRKDSPRTIGSRAASYKYSAGNFHGSRYSGTAGRAASSSPTIFSVAGSKRIERPSLQRQVAQHDRHVDLAVVDDAAARAACGS